ncbi:hypothetical protein ACFRQM_05930 [Streptomyces sp. NPDC056831]|uniref:hypothetical protein n=1 Tax=Streptomyces sp. NPDC056831 TaxID=3345954 RepID=UPI0036A5CFED
MTDDLSAGPVAEPAPRPCGPDDLRTLAAARRRTVDEHMFTAPGLPGACRLQLFTAPGVRPVAVVTQIAGEGMSLMNGAERFAGAVWERHCPDEDLPPVWVERQLWRAGSIQETRFRRVVFADADRYRPRGPRWSVITPEQLEALVGGPVETGRGAGYVPRPAEPEQEMVFEEFAVVRLARPRPFRQPECMPAGVPWWRHWARQVLPRRTARTCCWYHGGDWHTVSAMALEVLQRARAQAVEPDDMREFAVAHAAAAGATAWETEALATLFDTGDAIQPDRDVRYINGQHRSQAMLEAGVRRTVVLRHVSAT